SKSTKAWKKKQSDITPIFTARCDNYRVEETRSLCHTALPGGAGFSGTGVCSSPDSFWLRIDQLGEPESAAQTRAGLGQNRSGKELYDARVLPTIREIVSASEFLR